MTLRNRRLVRFQYKSDVTRFYVNKVFKYPKLAKEYFDTKMSDKEKQSCDMFVKEIKANKEARYFVINAFILDELLGSGNKSSKLLKGKKGIKQ